MHTYRQQHVKDSLYRPVLKELDGDVEVNKCILLWRNAYFDTFHLCPQSGSRSMKKRSTSTLQNTK